MKNIVEKIKKYLIYNERCAKFKFSSSTVVKFLAQGEYNMNFIVENDSNKYVFRINKGSQLNLENQIEYEFNAIKALEKSGVTPIGFFCDNSRKTFDEGILMMNFLEGKPLNYKRDLTKAAEIFSNIHSLSIAEFKDLLIPENSLCNDRVLEGERWLEPYIKSDLAPIKIKNTLNQLLEYCREESKIDKFFLNNPWLVVNNTEVNSHNFIIGEENSYLIDWEKPVISDPVQDITQFLAPTTTLWKADYILDEDEISSFYNSYNKERNQKYNIRERVELYKPFLYLRAFTWCASAWVEYAKGTREISNDDTFKKINMYLEDNFMKNLLEQYFKI